MIALWFRISSSISNEWIEVMYRSFNSKHTLTAQRKSLSQRWLQPVEGDIRDADSRHDSHPAALPVGCPPRWYSGATKLWLTKAYPRWCVVAPSYTCCRELGGITMKFAEFSFDYGTQQWTWRFNIIYYFQHQTTNRWWPRMTPEHIQKRHKQVNTANQRG